MKGRILSVDLIRGMAIIAMIQVHIWNQYFNFPMNRTLTGFKWFVQPVGGYAAPLFTLVAGLSAYLAVSARRSGRGRSEIVSEFFKRGMLLFALSTLINLVSGPLLNVLDISLLNWSIFQLVGACLCLAPLFFNLRSWQRLTIIILIMVTPLFSDSGMPTPKVLFTGFAPFFPWSFLFFSGMFIGPLFHASSPESHQRSRLMLGTSGLGLLLLAVLLHPSLPYQKSHIVQFNLTNATVYVGAFLLLLATFSHLLDIRGYGQRLSRWIVLFGQRSLTLYYLQLLAIVVSSMALTTLMGNRLQLPIGFFVPVLLIVLLSFHLFVNVLWRKFDYRYSLEWIFALAVKGNVVDLISRTQQSQTQES